MKSEPFAGANLMLGPPEGETEVESLPVMKMQGGGYLSQWRPSPAELVLLNAGAPVHLFVLGRQHPPVAVEVGPVGAGVIFN
jgi:hypothetical protein